MTQRPDRDLSIRKDVLDELAFEPQVDAAAIGVAVTDGVATLTGHIDTLAECAAAEAAARRVKGVRAIALEIEVRPYGAESPNDETIAARAADVLSWTAPKGGPPLGVSVHHGCVTLTGHVAWDYQRNEAERALRALSGVRSIRNEVVVTPHASVLDVEKQIGRAFHRSAELERAQLKVAVSGSTVTLSGRVKTWYEQDLAERAAWSTPGVTSVIDRIEIG